MVILDRKSKRERKIESKDSSKPYQRKGEGGREREREREREKRKIVCEMFT